MLATTGDITALKKGGLCASLIPARREAGLDRPN